ncbi:amino acid adenylation domain-containing protein, partial [Rhodococcus olei]|uniref:non-ribosomal peptide synthetase n=1 Tax=Rhodococcus olei TaxID=2161675 RepID=UPI0031E97B5D
MTAIDGFDSTDFDSTIQADGVEQIDVFPLSPAQLGMWYAQHVDPEVPINIAQYVDLRGPLNAAVLEHACIIASQEMETGYLRLTEIDGVPHQIVDRTIVDHVQVVDLRDEDDPVRAALDWMRADFATPVDLLHDRLIAGASIRIEDDRYFWYSRVHHIALDGFGAMTYMNRVAEVYTALLENQDIRPGKVWTLRSLYESELCYRESSRFATDREYWAGQVAGMEEGTSLVSRTAAPATVNGVASAALSDESASALDRAVARHGSSPSGMLIAAFAGYLARSTGKKDVVLSLPVTARTTAIMRNSGGMLSNVLPLRLHVGEGTTVTELLASVQTAVTGALRHQRYRHEDIRRDTAGTNMQRDLLGPLVNIMLFHDEVGLGPVVGEFHVLSTGTVEDLAVNFYQSVAGTRTHIDFETNPNLYTDDEARKHHSRFLGFFDKFLSADGDTRVWGLDLLTALERETVVSEWNATDRDVPEATLVSLFGEQVVRSPGAVALSFEGVSLTYAEFSERVNRVARHLMSVGVGPESLVAVAMRRSIDLLVTIYAVQAAGGAYVPVDPDQPRERVGHILDTAAPVCVVTSSRDGLAVPGERPVLVLDRVDVSGYSGAPIGASERPAVVRPENTAYVIFTSGSTGRPKGVAVSHAAIVNRLVWMQAEYGLGESDVVLQKTPVTFDVSVWELFWPLQVGARLVVAVPDGHRDPVYLAEVIARESVTTAHFVPSMLAVFVAALASEATGCSVQRSAAEAVSLVRVFASGEALPAATAATLRKVLPAARLHNLYGPTEAAVDVTFHEATVADEVSVPIGAPVWNTRTYVLDARLEPVPVGVPGELYLAGVQLARGYVGRTDLTSDRFVANPFAVGERMYRTGDLVSWNGSGELDYLGRTDFQVKLRGLRIELGEIEAALLAEGSVAQSVVVVRSDDHGVERLVGYVVPSVGAVVDADAVRAGLGAVLPAYMVPSAVVVLEEFPLNASGKLDRKALPAPVFASGLDAYRAPRTPAEEIVAGIFGDVLGVDRVGLDDNFFELGGNSLIANQVAGRTGAAFGIRIGVRTLFEAPTVGALTARAEAAARAGDQRVPLAAGPRPERVPLSLAQQRMWFLNQYDPSAATYNLPLVVRLSGRTDVAALRAALLDVLGRHESLRTVFPESAAGVHQVVLPVAEVDLDIVAETVAENELATRLVEFASTGFDVSDEIPVRVGLFEVSKEELAVALVVHHIAADGLSWAVLARDVMTAYTARVEGVAPGWAPLRVQYADFSLWQRAVLGSEDDPESLSAKQIRYWTDTLAGLPDQLDLPTDRPRPAVQSFRGARVGFEIPGELRDELSTLAREHGVTMFMVVHAALAVVLARLSGTTDIAIGTPIAGRGEEALDDVVGMFVNTLVLRTEVDPAASFADLLGQVRDRDLGAFGNADVPFERLVQVLSPARSTARHPLFQVVLSFENMGAATLELPELTVSAAEVQVDISKFDLQLTLRDQPDANGMEAEFVYATDLFEEESVAAIAARFERVLRAATAAPSVAVGDLDILDATERIELESGWGGPAEQPRTLADMMAAAAAFDPAATAVVRGDVALTYAELDARSSQLARLLIARGAGVETTVALALPRSVESVLAVWAVAKTGAAFVPVDPGYPADRIAHMVTDSGAVLGVTAAAHRNGLPGATTWVVLDEPGTAAEIAALPADPVADRDRLRPIRIGNPAYVIYTSGSTGLPKGVVVTHGGLANFTAEQVDRYGLTSRSRTLHFASPSFDASILELTMAVGAAATMIVAPTTVYGGTELGELLRTAHVTHAFVTPAALGSVDPTGLDELEAVVVGGEACPADLVSRWAPGRAMFNAYGPTESTVATNITGVLTPGVPVTIGGPIRGTQAVVLDTRLQPVPAGVAGELYVSGPALARGYRSLTGLTAGRFVANPFGEPGSRLYRTGDVVRWTAVGGDIEYVGRSDFQVKVRGFRIELGEIDAALTAHEAVDFAVTVGHRTTAGVTALVSYVRTVGTEVPTPAGLTAFVSETLPGYMVPAAVVVLDAIPLTPAGKVDRTALPEPVFESRPFREPATPAEETVAAVFADVLGVERVGADDDFFELGGNSLIATQVVARVGAALDTTVPVRVLFEASTVGALAAWAQTHAGAGRRVELGSIARPDALPLSLAQQRMWFLNRFDTESTVYNIPMAMRLTGDLDVDALAAAVADVVARHDVLRTVYPDGDHGPRQVVLDPADVASGLVRIRCTERELPTHLVELLSRGFDVTTEVPVRGALYELGEGEHVLALVVHHISADGWSMSPLARDVMVAYSARTAGAEPGWQPLPVQYADYALWQRAILGDETDPESLIAQQIEYWKSALAGLPDQLDLPGDRSRPAVASYLGATHSFEVDATLHAALGDLARRQGGTLFMVLHAALAVLLSRLSGTTDIAVGTPIAGRGEQALDDVIGMFVGTLVLRTEVDPANSFAELMDIARDADLGAFGHADVPFERLVEVISPARSTARHPLFQVMLSLQNMGTTAFELPGLRVAQLPFDEQVAKFDLQLDVNERLDEQGAPAGLSAEFTFATDLFDRSTVEGFARRFERILEAVVTDAATTVGDIELLASDERERVLVGWNDTAHETPAGTLVSLFDDQVARTPDAVALSFEGVSLSYAEFASRVHRLARHLISLGVGPEALVAVAMRRSVDLLVAIYAVQAAGGAYVPVDPDQPADRIGHILETADVVCVLSTARDEFTAPDGRTVLCVDAVDVSALDPTPVADAERVASLRASNTAYVIFTSGSTGRPKGVAVSHAAIVNRLVWMQAEYGLGESDVVLQKTPV